MTDKKQTALAESVMNKIKRGDVHMKPRVYYTLLSAVAGIAVVLAGSSTAYLSSIVFFWVRIQTADTMARGARANLSESIASFPWWLLIGAGILIGASAVLVRRHGRLYKHKASTIVALLVIASLLLGLGLSFLGVGKQHTPFHSGERGLRQGQNWQHKF